MLSYKKTCSFLHAHCTELIMAVETHIINKINGENSHLLKTYGIEVHWNCLIEVIPLYTYNICFEI